MIYGQRQAISGPWPWRERNSNLRLPSIVLTLLAPRGRFPSLHHACRFNGASFFQYLQRKAVGRPSTRPILRRSRCSRMDFTMPQARHTIQECPVCGRPLSIHSIHLGRRVTCQHCGGRFLASKPAVRNGSATAQANSLLQRADQLLEGFSRHLAAAPNSSR